MSTYFLNQHQGLGSVCVMCSWEGGPVSDAGSAVAKRCVLNRAELTMNDGTESLHLSQLHLFHCWLHNVGQLIYG